MNKLKKMMKAKKKIKQPVKKKKKKQPVKKTKGKFQVYWVIQVPVQPDTKGMTVMPLFSL